MGMPDAEGHGPPEGLPDLPPEWGRVVVPDDASALAEEAAQLRRELRRRSTPTRRLRPPLHLPVVILLVALLTTIAGLAAVTWPRSPRSPDRPTVLPYPSSSEPPVLTGRPLPALDLVDVDETPVPLRGLLPAMIILVDACVCAEEVAAVAAVAPEGVSVVTVTGGRTVASTPAAGGPVTALADPAGGLRAALRLSPRPDTAVALLVDRNGTVVRVLPALSAADDYRADLTRLAA
ncbi:serine/threonine-protein kinase [Micromonospora coxensis]|uniref:Thioredoxin domain-containing protein n=1 Tax=Micromonospora coxensis TaxID=356852 RepID=A0A1C5IIK8_9ACTN|nr:hypothetical protein [Micromonospora coxensis]SCG58187.1 hypothetical protein GA0070614_2874 [Micromonospora coxensis]